MPALTVQNQNYVEVGFANSPITLTCKDNQGNTFIRNTVIVDATTGIVQIKLPALSSLNPELQCEISFIVKDNTNDIIITADIMDGNSIGSQSQLTISAGGASGLILTLSAVTNYLWQSQTTT